MKAPDETLPFAVADLPADVRLEVVANQLQEAGYALDDLLAAPQGGFSRGYRRDLVDMLAAQNSEGPEAYVQLKAARNGLYDILPQNFFHDSIEDLQEGKRMTAHEATVRTREEEQQARRFFLPIEKEFFRARILLETEERKAMIGNGTHFKFDIFLRLWPELNHVDEAYLPALLQVLPVAQHFVGDLEAINQLFPNVLGTRVEAILEPGPHRICNDGTQAEIGSNTLGHTLVLGTNHLDYDPAVRLRIGPLTAAQAEGFMPGQPADLVLTMLLRYYLPLETAVQTEFILGPGEGGLALDDAPGRLGLSNVLGQAQPTDTLEPSALTDLALAG